MVTATWLEASRSARIVLQPNRSLDWPQTKIAFGLISLVAIGIAGWLATRGLWPILAFAVLEVLVLAVAFYRCAREGMRAEVVAIEPHAIAVEKGLGKPQMHWRVQRAWERVERRTDDRRGRPAAIYLRSHGKEIRIGGFLCENELETLAALLREALARTG